MSPSRPDPAQFHRNSGFTIALYARTIESLWSTLHDIFHPLVFLPLQADKLPPPPFSLMQISWPSTPEYVVEKNAINFLSDNGDINYNLCHCTFFVMNQKGSGFR